MLYNVHVHCTMYTVHCTVYMYTSDLCKLRWEGMCILEGEKKFAGVLLGYNMASIAGRWMGVGCKVMYVGGGGGVRGCVCGCG